MKEDLYPSFKILIVDDEQAWLRSLRISLARLAGITNVITCQDSRQVIDILNRNDVGVVLLDLTMPYLSGDKLLQLINEQFPEVVTVVVSGMNQVDTAVKCMKQGAFDYLVKTSEEERIITVVLHAIRMIEMQRENIEISRRFFSEELSTPDAFSKIVTASQSMHSIFKYLEAVSKSSQPLLITGESGVGKGLIAQAVHKLSNCKGELVAVNVGGLDDNIFSDTLFGHVKGAFTGADAPRSGMVEKAAQGTLFLDEIGDLTIASQIKLLRLLQEGDYYPLGSDQPKRLRARVIASTNQDLERKLQKGEFRRDLYYRLKSHHVHIPPLRERREDIFVLFNHFINEACQDMGRQKPHISENILSLLQVYNFPGNVRELKAMTFDAIARCQGDTLTIDHFNDINKNILPHSGQKFFSASEIFDSLDELPTINQAVRLLIYSAMKRAKGNQSIAAKLLGISQPALSKRMKQMDGNFLDF
ncbi:MAG: sigma-54 dependent transcriptional regulator [Thermodesulfovibrionales bacterium]|nr:sigma-54 dependent transcriptional regulator [Thermodesulfovibrionales bacterium]